MKRILSLLLLVWVCVSLCLLFSSCGSDSQSETTWDNSMLGAFLMLFGVCGLAIGFHLANEDYIPILHVPLRIVSALLLFFGFLLFAFGNLFY